METEIKIAVSYVKVTHEIKSIDLPETDLFFKKGDAETYDYQIFAILLYGKNPQSGHYSLLWIKNNEQLFTDFIPRKDVQSEFWVDGNGFRKTALSIIDKSSWGWEEITKEEFLKDRISILNRHIDIFS